MTQPALDPLVLRLCLWILRVARRVVPRSIRDQWIREWEAELRYRWNAIERQRGARCQRHADLVRQSSGAFADAAFLRQQFTADLDIVQDARYGVRMLRKRPLVSGLAVIVLALGLGGTITVFSTIDTLLFRELPYADSDRIVTVWQNEVTRLDERLGVASAAFLDWRARTKSFSSLAAAEGFGFDYFEGPEPVQLPASLVTEGFFEALGVRPVRGRLFRPEELRGDRTSCCSVTPLGSDDSVVTRRWLAERSGSTGVRSSSPVSFRPRFNSFAAACKRHRRRAGGSGRGSLGAEGSPELRPTVPAGPFLGRRRTGSSRRYLRTSTSRGLDEHLTHQPPPPGTDRDAHRKLTMTLDTAGDQQASDGAAPVQQHHQNRSEEEPRSLRSSSGCGQPSSCRVAACRTD